MKPIIAITTNFSSADIGTLTNLGVSDQQWNFLATDYAAAIEKAGGVPILVPSYSSADIVEKLISRCDGVLLSGGSDVSPHLYGEDVAAECSRTEIMRDYGEYALPRALLEKSSIPVLGICRGCQLLNVAGGGTLFQHLDDSWNAHMVLSVPRGNFAHRINIDETSNLFSIVGKNEMLINSYHHQAIKDLADGFKIVANADDGIPEAIELDGERFVMGVQWHPEMLANCEYNASIIRHFVEKCSHN